MCSYVIAVMTQFGVIPRSIPTSWAEQSFLLILQTTFQVKISQSGSKKLLRKIVGQKKFSVQINCTPKNSWVCWACFVKFFCCETKFVAQKIVSSITFEVSKFLSVQNKLWVKRNAEKKSLETIKFSVQIWSKRIWVLRNDHPVPSGSLCIQWLWIILYAVTMNNLSL